MIVSLTACVLRSALARGFRYFNKVESKMTQMRILIIEDNQDIAGNICEYLDSQGHITDYAADGVVGLHLSVTGNFDAVVLDVMLPGIDGLEVCKRIRKSSISQPAILMLTALDALQDKLSGFDVGADDYLVKPFALEELYVRLKSLVSRGKGRYTPQLKVGKLVMDTGAMTVERDNVPIKLNRITFKILRTLMENYPSVTSRQGLEFSVWGDEPPGSDALRSHIYTLRNKVDKDFSFPMIHTLHGVGFKLAVSDEL